MENSTYYGNTFAHVFLDEHSTVYIYIFIHTYTHIFICICICGKFYSVRVSRRAFHSIYIYIYIYIYTHIHMYIYMWKKFTAHVFLDEPSTAHIYIYVDMYIFIYIYSIYTWKILHIMEILLRTCFSTSIPLHIYIYLYIHIRTYLYVYVYVENFIAHVFLDEHSTALATLQMFEEAAKEFRGEIAFVRFNKNNNFMLKVRCSVVQFVAVRSRVVQSGAVFYRVLQCVEAARSFGTRPPLCASTRIIIYIYIYIYMYIYFYIYVYNNFMLKVCRSVSQCVVVRCRVVQFVAVCCRVLWPPKNSWSEIIFMHLKSKIT